MRAFLPRVYLDCGHDDGPFLAEMLEERAHRLLCETAAALLKSYLHNLSYQCDCQLIMATRAEADVPI